MADVQIIITIPEAKVDKLQEGYLYARPKPGSFAGNNVAWLKYCICQDINYTVKDGLRSKAAAQEAVDDSYAE